MANVDQTVIVRPFEGWFVRGLVRGHLEAPQTRLALDEEYWLALRHAAEVRPAGMAQLARTDPGFASLEVERQEEQWRDFRAYVRQAEGFYRGACVLPWKLSPLNYYYSFMNLAKAVAVAQGGLHPQPAARQRPLKHGVSARVVPGSPDVWRLIAQSPDDVFGILYRAAVGTGIAPGAHLDARELLGYVSSISWQLGKSGRATGRNWWPCYWVFLANDDSVWDVIGMPRACDLSRLPAALSDSYQELSAEAARPLAQQTLGLQAVQANTIRLLQRKIPHAPVEPGYLNVTGVEQSLRAAIPNCLFEHLDSTRFQFCVGIPYPTANGPVPMNELVATYAVMYFLSSLVRYHPEYMDRIGESTDAWLIESFVKSAPLSLLRHMVSLCLGYTLIIEHA